MGSPSNSSSSSGEEDGDAEWKAAIDSLASTTPFTNNTSGAVASHSSASINNKQNHNNDDDDDGDYYYKSKPKPLKHYQIKAQKLLDGVLEKEIEIVKNPTPELDEKALENDGGVRLFKKAPPGIVFDHTDELQRPTRKPRLLPGTEVDEKSKKFRQQLQFVTVDGSDIMTAARDACQKSLAKLEAKIAAAKAAAKREEDRVAELKRIRGERWLPSVAKETQVNFRR